MCSFRVNCETFFNIKSLHPIKSTDFSFVMTQRMQLLSRTTYRTCCNSDSFIPRFRIDNPNIFRPLTDTTITIITCTWLLMSCQISLTWKGCPAPTESLFLRNCLIMSSRRVRNCLSRCCPLMSSCRNAFCIRILARSTSISPYTLSCASRVLCNTTSVTMGMSWLILLRSCVFLRTTTISRCVLFKSCAFLLSFGIWRL